jgi:hypothetical protein
MNDPHVVALRYRLVPAADISFDNPPPVERTRPQFDFRLSDGLAVATMTDHFATAVEARSVVDAYLRAYEMRTTLIDGTPRFHFEFDKAQVADRRPPLPGEPQSIQLAAILSASATFAASLHVGYSRYPDPPDQFTISPDVETLWHRYEGYKAGRELLTSMAYFCHTFVEKVAFQGSTDAANKLRIARPVLARVGHLANVGDYRTARKADIRVTERRPHTPAELAWLENAVRMMIKRMAEYEFDPGAVRPQVTMMDLPELK